MAVKRKPKPLFFVIFISVIIVIIAGINAYLSSPVDRHDDNIIEVNVPSGTSSKQIGSILKEKELIKNETYFSVYIKLFSKKPLKASSYQFTKSMSLKEIVEVLEKGNNYNPDDISITFKEGQRITQYAKAIEEKTNYSSEDVLNIMKNKEYIKTLINKYWFLTDKILNSNIYYPLEGYLAPDTYFFNKKASIEDIIETLLNNEEKKLEKYKSVLNTTNIHDKLTMASIVELEGTNTENRKEILGVFNNRLELGMNLGSDVTTYYALQLPLTQDLSSDQFSVNNPYNTRSINMMGKLPVGPICNPSLSSIEASVNPKDNDYIYFVADKNGKIYYTKTLQEHERKVAEIKEKGDWIW